MLGWEMSPEQLGERRPDIAGAAGNIRNLHFVGHWTRPSGGITPVIVSAQQVATAVVRGTKQDSKVSMEELCSRTIATS
jgi:phytoene dehydrogenase-like protein